MTDVELHNLIVRTLFGVDSVSIDAAEYGDVATAITTALQERQRQESIACSGSGSVMDCRCGHPRGLHDGNDGRCIGWANDRCSCWSFAAPGRQESIACDGYGVPE